MKGERGKLPDEWIAGVSKGKKDVFQRPWSNAGQSTRRFSAFNPIGRSELVEPRLEYLRFDRTLVHSKMER